MTPPGPLVYKFGGSSVADASRIQEVARLISEAETPPVVVVSALAKVTDQLVRAAEDLRAGRSTRETRDALEKRHLEVLHALCAAGPERTSLEGEIRGVLARLDGEGAGATRADGSPIRPRRSAADAARAGAVAAHFGAMEGDASEGAAAVVAAEAALLAALAPSEDPRSPESDAALTDSISAIGEDLSARLLACALRARGVSARFVDARSVVRTDDTFGRARPDEREIDRLARRELAPLLEAGTVPVVQGFVGATSDGRTTTLGRGGSDFTAAILGGALGARMVHIWTDVDGILSSDPRVVGRPLILPEVGFEEAVELAYFGAKVIHPGAAKHAVSRRVPLLIRNTFNPSAPGTVILSDRRGAPQVAAIAYKPKVVLIKVRSHPTALQYGFLARVFEVLGRLEMAVDLVATSHSSTAFTIDENEQLDAVKLALSEFADVEVLRDLATVTVVGHGLLEEPGIDALVFWAVEKTPVHLISQASDVSLSFVVGAADAQDVVRKLHLTLIELRDEGGRDHLE